jgi:hypothetical protein
MDLTKISEFLVWIVSGGSIVAFSFFAERWPWFQAQTAELKRWIMWGICALLSVGALAVQTYVPSDILVQLAPWFSVIAASFVTIFVSENFHSANKK